jgi:polysaccharide pyruvyl transferase WcaK-like protein
MAETVLIAGYYGRRNAGDEAILGGMLADLRAARVDLRFRVVSWDPDGTQRLHGVEAIPWTDVAGLIDAVREASLVVVGGGGCSRLLGRRAGAILTSRQAGSSVRSADRSRPPYGGAFMLYSVGVGPLPDARGRQLARELFEAIGAATVRDARRRDCWPSWVARRADRGRSRPGVPSPPVPADPAVTRVLRSMQRPILGVSLRHWEFGDVPAEWQAGLAAAIDDHLAEKGGTALLVPLQDGELEVEDDASVSRLVIARMERGGQAALVPDGLDPLQRFRLLEGCDAVLGMRLHAVIAALRGGVPVVGLAYDPKVAALMEASGLGGACLGPEGWQREWIAAALRAATARPRVMAIPEGEDTGSRSAEIAPASSAADRVPLGEAALRGMAIGRCAGPPAEGK